MSNQRKQIVLNEIAFWKQNKLLPEHYCDFLSTLYTEGNHEDEKRKANRGASIKGKEKRRNRTLSTVFISIAVLMVLMLFAMEIEWMVIAIVGFVAIGGFLATLILANKKNALAPMLQVATALLFLGVTVKVCMTYFAGNNTALYSSLAINCVLWLISGLLTKLHYFTVSGILGLAALGGFWFYIQ
ncbi:MAG: hypothetical protein ABS951_13775 [Solibacillus sp.]